MNTTQASGSLFDRIPNIFDRPYQWKQFDCFTLAQTIRQAYNVGPLPEMDWVYVAHPTEDTAPPNLVLELLREYTRSRIGAMRHLDLLALDFHGSIALGTVLNVGGELMVVYMGKERAQTAQFDRVSGLVRGVFWY